MVDVALLLGLLAAWQPPEVFPWTAPALALGVLLALPGLRHRPVHAAPPAIARSLLPFLALAAVSWFTGWDRSAVVPLLGLTLLALVAGWSAASNPRPRLENRLAAGLALLGVWGLYQTLWGFRALEAHSGDLPGAVRDAILFRAGTRRAVAGLGLPGHLAIVLVMALPILLDALRTGRRRTVWGALVLLDLAGIAATRSLIGAALAVGVIVLLAPPRRRAVFMVTVVLISGAVVLSRGDLLSSAAPILQRLDNWRTALWIWSRQPLLGAGPGSFRQAAQGVPFPVSSVSSYAHDLPLQALAELGPAGLFATILALWWVARLVRRGWEANRALAVAVAVVPLHNLLDFSVLLSGVAVPWAVLTGFLRARVEPGPEWRPVPGRIRVAFGIAALAGLVLASLTTASRIFEERAARRGSLADATRAIRIAPWRVRPRLAAADLALDRRTSAPALEEARNAVTTGLRLAPRSAALWLAAARLDLIRGDPLAALAETRAAVDARPGWPPATRFLHRLRSNLRRTP